MLVKRMPQDEYQILDFLVDGVVIVDRSYTIVFANQALGQLYGAAPEEIIGRKCYDLSHNRVLPCDCDCLEGSRCSHAAVFSSGHPLTLTHRHTLSDGTTKIFEITTSPVVDEHGEVRRIMQLLKDVTQLEKLRKEAEASHRELHLIFDNAPFAISFVDRELRVVRINPAMEAFVGMRSSEIQGRHCYDCWGQYAGDESRAGRAKICDCCMVEQALADGRKHVYLCRIGERVKEVTTIPVRDQQDVIIGAMEVGRDITEETQATEALAESERRFRLLAETIEDVFWMSTPGIETMLYVSPSYEKVWGRTCQSLYENPRSFVEAIHPEDKGAVLAGIENHKKGVWDFEYRIIRRDGDTRWIHDRGFPVRGEQGALVLMTGICTDITEQKLVEEALRESEARYRVLFENSPNVICIGDFSGIRKYLAKLVLPPGMDCETFFGSHPEELASCLGQLRIVETNQAALDLFGGASRAELIEGLFNVVGPEAVPHTLGGICAIGKGLLRFEHEIVTNHLVTGEKIHAIVRWSVSPGYEQSYERIIISLTDITARKRVENALALHLEQVRNLSLQLVQAEEAERRRIARELHDKLGQRLTAMGINLHILRQEATDGALTQSNRRFEDSLGLVEEMTELVRDIMADLRPPVLDDYGLSAALRWYAAQFSKRTGMHVANTGMALPRLAPTMEMMLFRIVQEALINAAKHSGANEVEVNGHMDGKKLTLEISDKGKGFAGDVWAESLAAGRHMGFISMRERVEAFGGTLTVDTAPGAGVRIMVEVTV